MTRKITALLFPGQGAQFAGMGKSLYEAFPIVREIFQEGDDRLSLPLSKWILEGPEEELKKTAISQPAIYLFSWAVTCLIRSLFPQIQPSFAAGLSLGEYTAFAASGIIDPWEGLHLVRERGKLMSEACDKHPGTMAAILGLTEQEIEAVVKEVGMPQDLWSANFNAPGQTVISGTLKGVQAGSLLAKEKGAKVIPLNVHGAFHSGLMKSAQDSLKEYIEATRFSSGSMQVIMNVSASFPKTEQEIKEGLVQQIVSPIRWQKSLEKLDQEKGVQLYVELGCGKTLSALNKRVGVKGITVSIDAVNAIELLEKEVNT